MVGGDYAATAICATPIVTMLAPLLKSVSEKEGYWELTFKRNHLLEVVPD